MNSCNKFLFIKITAEVPCEVTSDSTFLVTGYRVVPSIFFFISVLIPFRPDIYSKV